MKKIPEVPIEYRKEKQNSDERYSIWLSLLRKLEKEDEITVHATKGELADFLGEWGTLEKFIVDYRIFMNGKETNYGVHFYFESFGTVCAVLVDYRGNENSPATFNWERTPLSKWKIYSTDNEKTSFEATWEFTYYLLLQCIEFFSGYKGDES